MSNIQTIKLEEIAEFINGGAWNQTEYSDFGIPVVRVSDIHDCTVDLKDCKYLPDSAYERYAKHELHEGDLVICTVGSHPTQPNSVVGRPGIIPKSASGALLNQNVVCIKPRSNNLDKTWLGYFARSQYVKDYIIAHARGSANQVRVAIGALKSIDVPLPDIETQKQISEVLKAYDNLIENNNRRITILEEMAQSLYREWFVKFRFPGHENIKFIDSPLGKIPEGWEVKSVGELLEFDIGGGWGKEAPDGKHSEPGYVIRGTDLQSVWQGDIDSVPYRYHTKSNIKSRRLIKNDIIFEASGGSKGQPVGRTGLVTKELLKHIDQDLICASFCKIVRAKSAELAHLLLNHIRFIYENGHIMKYQVQSTGISNFKFKVFLESEFMIIPDAYIRADFLENIEKFTDMCQKLAFSNRNLKKQRDLLLPKLISGNVKIGNA